MERKTNREIRSPAGDALLTDYARRLRVTWPWSWTFANVPSGQIVVDPENKRHRIVFPFEYQGNEQRERYSFAHEMTHALLAERNDPILSTVFFDQETFRQNNYPEIAESVHFCQEIVDLWVDEEVAKQLGSHLVVEGRNALLTTLLNSIMKQPEWAGSPIVMMSWFMGSAEVTRRIARASANLVDKLYSRIRQVVDKATLNELRAFRDELTNLPSLSGDPATDVPLFERTTQAVARLFQIPIDMHIVQEMGKRVWHAEEQ